MIKLDLRLLIVEDNDHLRKVLIGYFKKRGVHSIFEAADGKEALSICENENINFIISDWRMPELSGIEFLKILREKGAPYHQIPFIMLTVNMDEKQIAAARALNADDYLIKPSRLSTLEKSFEQTLLKRNIDHYLALAFTHIMENDYKAAMTMFKTAYQEKREHPVLLCGLVIASIELGHFEDPIKYYSEIPKDYESPLKCYTDGVLAEINGNTEKAIEHFQKCIKIEPSFVHAYFKLYRLYTATKDKLLIEDLMKKFETISIRHTAIAKELLIIYQTLDKEIGGYENQIQKYRQLIKDGFSGTLD